jgi:hypothetical protein
MPYITIGSLIETYLSQVKLGAFYYIMTVKILYMSSEYVNKFL